MSPELGIYNRALAAFHEGDHGLCQSLAGMMLERDLQCGPAHLLRGLTRRDDEVLLSVASLGAASRYSSLDAEVWYNRAVTAENLGHRALAIDCYRRAHALDPTHIATLLNGTQLLRITEHFAEAVNMAQRLQCLLPNNPAGYANEAVAQIYLGDAERSDWAFAQAIRLSDDPSLLLWEQHFSLLARHRFEEAWQNYECRFACSSAVGVDDMAFDLPRWNGEPDHHVITYGEQGLGDQIMFASMVEELVQDCSKVTIAVSAPLASLFASSFPSVTVFPVANGTDPQECSRLLAAAGKSKPVDSRIALGSLLARYRNKRSDFTGTPYLKPSPAVTESWKARELGEKAKGKGKLKIGLCWASNPAPERFFSARRASHKTMPLKKCIPLVERLPGAQFIAITNVPLNHFEDAGLAHGRIEDVSAMLTDLEQTAGLLQNIDLLITVDTGVAHLAGALGVPVWILLHEHGDARWGEPDEWESYWYNSARLFWQKTSGDWDGLIERVGQNLESFAKGPEQQAVVQ